MSEPRSDVAILNLDHSYTVQSSFLHDPCCEWLDMQDVQATSRYCTSDTLLAIQRRLQHRKNTGITLIGNGNYHYVSYALLKEIKQPFTLLLFDHHTDLLPSPAPVWITCGSWVEWAMTRLPLLTFTVMVGVRPDLKDQIPPSLQTRLAVFPETEVSRTPSFAASLLRSIPTEHVYISIDKDVLHPSQALTNWDQGHLTLEDLKYLLQHLFQKKQILGADICGEWPVSPFASFRADAQAAIRKNEKANHNLIQWLRSGFTRKT